MALDSLACSIIEFWFGSPPLVERDAWFRKDDALDASIAAHFGDAVVNACEGAFAAWNDEPRGALARILLLDQFTRNIWRDTADAFHGDALALQTAQRTVDRGYDRELAPLERRFVYMPYTHCENVVAQQRGVDLFRALAADSGLTGPLDWALRHARVIRMFGRFPHRNAQLGRQSTPEETAFLATPGSRF